MIPNGGWHAVRRRLATTLSVPDKIIQAILRHQNVSVTQSCYINTVAADAQQAMRKLECATNVQLKRAAARVGKPKQREAS